MRQNEKKRENTIHQKNSAGDTHTSLDFFRRGAYKKEKRQGGGLSERRRRTETKKKNRRAGGWDRTERKGSTPSTEGKIGTQEKGRGSEEEEKRRRRHRQEGVQRR